MIDDEGIVFAKQHGTYLDMDMALDELREARDLTQEQLARVLHINQAAVSKMERRADMYAPCWRLWSRMGSLPSRSQFPSAV
jgi:DNA-binding XRE family transcriptional regulator